MNYLRFLNIPVLAGLLALTLASCPKEPDQTNVSIEDQSGAPSTTIVETEETPPADTNININVDASPDEPVVVAEEVRTQFPEVVAVLESQVASPTETTTVYVPDAPAVEVWTTQVVPATPPADVVYRIRDFDFTSVTDTELVGEGYVLVASPSPDFTSERKYLRYTFQKDPADSTWKIYNIEVTRTEPATPEDLGTASGAAAGDAGSAGEATGSGM